MIGGTDPTFAAATFALPTIGAVSSPMRTPWGWDLILLTDIIPAQTMTRDELVAKLFPGLRRGYFDQVWAAQLEKGHAISENADLLEEEDEEDNGSGAGSGSAGGGGPRGAPPPAGAPRPPPPPPSSAPPSVT